MTPRIRDATLQDWPAIWPIVREVVRAGDTFTYDPHMSEAAASALWMVGAPGRTTVAADGPAVLGTANMYANRDGPGAHVASASFMVASGARGCGVGRALVEDALSWARAAGFSAMQFNAVAETNAAAVALYRALGFAIVGTVPDGFNHPRQGLVGLHVMHRSLSRTVPAISPVRASAPRDIVAHVNRPPEWLAVRDEVSRTLAAVSSEQMRGAAALLTDRGRRWFCTGQGRSGLVARMAAMRLMHVGFSAHAVGDATTPSIDAGDGLLVFSGSGETPVTLHLARLAQGVGAHLLAVTARADSTVAALAEAVVEVPTGDTRQFGGSLFEQSALLLVDALILDLTAGEPAAHAAMHARHANLE